MAQTMPIGSQKKIKKKKSLAREGEGFLSRKGLQRRVGECAKGPLGMCEENGKWPTPVKKDKLISEGVSLCF